MAAPPDRGGRLQARAWRPAPSQARDEWRGASPHDRMWAALGPGTIENIAAGSHAMAVLWQSAWKHGGGDGLPSTKLKKVPPPKLQALYTRHDFVESFRLSDLKATNQSFEAPGLRVRSRTVLCLKRSVLLMVPRGGIEPPTPAFSVQCSTN